MTTSGDLPPLTMVIRGSERSSYRGVSYQYRQGNGYWTAKIKTSGSQRYLGTFSDDRDAALAYDEAARAAGLLDRLNFPTQQEIMMAAETPKTFTAWLRGQEYRADATGQLAQFWRDHTPGRISAVAGVQKHLTMLRDSPHSGGDLSAEAATCLTLLDAAVREYEAAREGRPPLAAVPEPVTFPVQPDHVIALPDGSYVDTSATPWQHVSEIGRPYHVTGQCEACMPAVRAVVPDQDGLWPAESAGDGTVPAAAADQVLGASGRYTGDDTIVSYVPSSPVREAVGRATAAGVQAAQAHAVSNAQHERDPHPFDVALARIESKLDRLLDLLGLDDESMAENIAAEIAPDLPGPVTPAMQDWLDGKLIHDAGPNRADDEGREPTHGHVLTDQGVWPTTWLDQAAQVPQADDFARLYELADFGEEG